MTVTYDLRTLEEKKIDALKDMKLLLADRAKLMSLAKIDASFRGKAQEDNRIKVDQYVFPDRVKVVHVKREKGPKSYKASFE